MIELQHVSYHVSSKSAEQNDQNKDLIILNDCNLKVHSKQSVAIIGRSGSGKSTLLSLMAGLEKPSSGQVILLDQALAALNEDQRAGIRAQQVGFIFQNFQLMPTMTALENVLMPLELFNVKHARQKALDALQTVGLAERASHTPAELSGGEQQRVAIARAIVTEPKILFADEPTGNLDEQTAVQIQQLLFELNAQLNTTLIVVTHDKALAQLCDQSYQLIDGQLAEVTEQSMAKEVTPS